MSNVQDAANLLYSSYIKYDRLFNMTQFAFYGNPSIAKSVDIYIDIYSIVRSLYSRGYKLRINETYSIASCLINLAIHLRAYFQTRHGIYTKVYLIYGGGRPVEAINRYSKYNENNILMEDSDFNFKQILFDNFKIMDIVSPYLPDMYFICDENNEFNCITSALIDMDEQEYHIIYSKDQLSYQLVAYKPHTFMYRPKKSHMEDVSWVVTKSTLYDAYRHGESQLKRQMTNGLDCKTFNLYQAISGLRSRSLPCLINANSTILLLGNGVNKGLLINGYNPIITNRSCCNLLTRLLQNTCINSDEVHARLSAIDLPFQYTLYKNSISYKELPTKTVDLYDPEGVKEINNKYFSLYPLDLNRV